MEATGNTIGHGRKRKINAVLVLVTIGRYKTFFEQIVDAYCILYIEIIVRLEMRNRERVIGQSETIVAKMLGMETNKTRHDLDGRMSDDTSLPCLVDHALSHAQLFA